MIEKNAKNVERKYSVVKYGSGPWDGKWVVRRTTTEDVGAMLDQFEARKLAEILRDADIAQFSEHHVGKEIG